MLSQFSKRQKTRLKLAGPRWPVSWTALARQLARQLDRAGPRRTAPLKSLKTNNIKAVPLNTLRKCSKALFLLAKTKTAGSCMTCVQNLRFEGPKQSKSQTLFSICWNRKPAKNALASILFMSLSTLVSADSWSKSGSFNLSGDVTEVSGTQWSLPVLEWRASKQFEMGTPGFVPDNSSPLVIQGGSPMSKLLSLISQAESPRGQYNAVHGGARIMPPALPTALTVGEIFNWIRETPNQNHAIGRYQIIPSTLAYLVEAEGIPHSARFDVTLQDRLAFRLIRDAGWDKFRAGQMSSSSFMDALAGVWAGLPKADGRSVYHGYAGNRATITRASYQSAFAQIFP